MQHLHKGKSRIYSISGERKFEQEYGKQKGKKVWGAVVGKEYRNQHGKNWNAGKVNCVKCKTGLGIHIH